MLVKTMLKQHEKDKSEVSKDWMAHW